MTTATETLLRIDLRRARADALTAEILRALEPYIEDRVSAYGVLRELLRTKGVEVITDEAREEAGLPPRDGMGWTADELCALERMRLGVITRPLTHAAD